MIPAKRTRITPNCIVCYNKDYTGYEVIPTKSIYKVQSDDESLRLTVYFVDPDGADSVLEINEFIPARSLRTVEDELFGSITGV